MSYHLTLVRIAIIKKSTNNKCWRGCREKGAFLHCWWESKLMQPLWRTVWKLLEEWNIELPYDPALPLLGIYTEKNMVNQDACTPVFIAVLFTTAKIWKQPKYPSIEEWIKKMWYICMMQYYSVDKTKQSYFLNIHWKDWCWSWSSDFLATWCEELTHSKRLWCWERLKEDGGKGDDRGWGGWMASLTQWTWVWASSRRWWRRWWRTGKPGMLQYMGLQKVGHDWVTGQEQQMPSAATWIDLATVIPGDVSQTEKDINYTMLLICRI